VPKRLVPMVEGHGTDVPTSQSAPNGSGHPGTREEALTKLSTASLTLEPEEEEEEEEKEEEKEKEEPLQNFPRVWSGLDLHHQRGRLLIQLNIGP